MKAMFAGFAAAIVIAIGAHFALDSGHETEIDELALVSHIKPAQCLGPINCLRSQILTMITEEPVQLGGRHAEKLGRWSACTLFPPMEPVFGTYEENGGTGLPCLRKPTRAKTVSRLVPSQNACRTAIEGTLGKCCNRIGQIVWIRTLHQIIRMIAAAPQVRAQRAGADCGFLRVHAGILQKNF